MSRHRAARPRCRPWANACDHCHCALLECVGQSASGVTLCMACPTHLAIVASKGAHTFTGVGVVDGQGDAIDCGKVLPAVAEAHVTAALDGNLVHTGRPRHKHRVSGLGCAASFHAKTQSWCWCHMMLDTTGHCWHTEKFQQPSGAAPSWLDDCSCGTFLYGAGRLTSLITLTSSIRTFISRSLSANPTSTCKRRKCQQASRR